MALAYFDSSALVKLLIEEDGTSTARELWRGADACLSSRLAYPEVCAALSALGRGRHITKPASTSARHAWGELWSSVRPVEFTEGVERLAGELTTAHPLRGADAVHLASALAVEVRGLVVVGWDRTLAHAAARSGLAVAPAEVG